jgi:hypothetical protein
MLLFFRRHNLGMNIPQFTALRCFGLSGHHLVHRVFTIPFLPSVILPYTGQCLHIGSVLYRRVVFAMPVVQAPYHPRKNRPRGSKKHVKNAIYTSRRHKSKHQYEMITQKKNARWQPAPTKGWQYESRETRKKKEKYLYTQYNFNSTQNILII